MKDIILQEDLSPMLRTGDFLVADSGEQHIGMILNSSFGDWRQTPLLGANIAMLVLAEAGSTAIRHSIEEQLDADGASVEDISIAQGKIHVEATYPL